jgi:hypothetical protein
MTEALLHTLGTVSPSKTCCTDMFGVTFLSIIKILFYVCVYAAVVIS